MSVYSVSDECSPSEIVVLHYHIMIHAHDQICLVIKGNLKNLNLAYLPTKRCAKLEYSTYTRRNLRGVPPSCHSVTVTVITPYLEA